MQVRAFKTFGLSCASLFYSSCVFVLENEIIQCWNLQFLPPESVVSNCCRNTLKERREFVLASLGLLVLRAGCPALGAAEFHNKS